VACARAVGHRSGQTLGITPTESPVEWFGLLTIIVLGEVVFGVVAGLSGAEHDLRTIVTGLVALVVGFGFWWIYFDVVGAVYRIVMAGAIATWMVSYCPITLSIAAAGAGVI
jgi:low temperature requirement protein LtrA